MAGGMHSNWVGVALKIIEQKKIEEGIKVDKMMGLSSEMGPVSGSGARLDFFSR
jgi:hypothetical protein